MSNAASHRRGAAAALALVSAVEEYGRTGKISTRTVLVACGGAACGTLPDLVEPAIHPNHRQFFHSVTFAALLAIGLYEIYLWQPQTDADKLIKVVLLIAGGAYLVHLIMDSQTKKSLPVI